MSDRRGNRGLPIAAHLALLVALAFGAAYIVNLAIVLALPPRPPAVVRGDVILSLFEAGYRAALRDGRTPRGEGVRWTISQNRPSQDRFIPAGRHLAGLLAKRIEISPRRIVVAGDPAPGDMFVYRVRAIQRH